MDMVKYRHISFHDQSSFFSSLWHWTVPNTSSCNLEIARIHNHLIHNLQAKRFEPIPPSELAEFSFSNPVKYTPISTASWFRVCQFLHHVRPTITGTGGGVSTKITDPYLRGELALKELTDQPQNPRYDVTNKTRIATNTCFKVVLSEAQSKLYIVTPACPNGQESIQNDRLVDPLQVLPTTQKIISAELMTEQTSDRMPSSRIVKPTPERNAKLKAALLPSPHYLRAVDATLQRDVLECDAAFATLLDDRLKCFSVSSTCAVSGQAFAWRDFIIRTGVATVDGRALDSEVLVEIEYLGGEDVRVDPLLFAVTFNTCIPQHTQLYFREANSHFSPCYDHDPREVNPPYAADALMSASPAALVAANSGEASSGQCVGHRVSAAHLGAVAMYGLSEHYDNKHAALQYIQLLLHLQNK